VGPGRVNHSSAGAALAEDRLTHPVGRVLAYMVAGHHAGLPDWDPSDTGNGALRVRLTEGRENLARVAQHADAFEGMLRPLSRPPGQIRPDGIHLWMRMLFSCLV